MIATTYRNQNAMVSFSELNLLKTYKFDTLAPFLLDVGAHNGSFSLPFAKRGWQVIAFEPEQNNNIAFNRKLGKFENVTCVQKAVSDSTGEKLPFYVSDEHYGIHSLRPFHHTHRFAYEVETVQLNDVLREKSVTDVTLLKIDIEGADFLALKGFDFIKFKPEVVMIEFMDERSIPNFNYTHHDVVSFMRDRGYFCYVSEWAPIIEYGRPNGGSTPHKWLQCEPYPLNHEPAWGNLIFVSANDCKKFEIALKKYLNILKIYRLVYAIADRTNTLPILKFLNKYRKQFIQKNKIII